MTARKLPPPRIDLPRSVPEESRADRVNRWLREQDALEKEADEAGAAMDAASAECDRLYAEAMAAYEAFNRAVEKYEEARAAAHAAIEASDKHYRTRSD